MTYLLDVNVLIALCDAYHVHHEAAHRWFGAVKTPLWATCPLTENAFIRITGKPSYPRGQGSAAPQLDLLRDFCSLPGHTFWPDDVSLLQPEIWVETELLGSSHLTDLYLLALAIRHDGKLASFDQHIPSHRIRGGTKALFILPS
jgi:uncharacterized protein